MKRFMSAILVMVFLLAASAAVPACAEGSETIEIWDGRDKLTLSVQEYGYTRDDHTEYTVTVGGYNVLLAGKSGNLSDIMPFKVAIAWDTETYLTADSFAVTMDQVTNATFRKESGAPIDEPKYILIAPKGTDIQDGWYYVIDEGQFRPVKDMLAERTVVPEAIGDIVYFGRYPQTAKGMDQTPIEWIVLRVRGGKALVISRYGLDVKRYNTEEAAVTWETCSLRAWLNSDFLNAAFTPEEQAAISVTCVDNSAAQGYGEWKTKGGKDTQDRVFLLSCAEANRYFGVITRDKNTKASIQPTAYAIRQGAYTRKDIKTENGSAGWWWLRSPGNSQRDAAVVYLAGTLSYDSVSRGIGCVRPAMWINLESEIYRSENAQDGAEPQGEAVPETGVEDSGDQPETEPQGEGVPEAGTEDSGNRPETEPQAKPVGAGVLAGDIVTFGRFPQTAGGTDQTPIEWIVLSVQDGKALMISRCGLDSVPYNTEKMDVTWEICTMRAWLNSDFLNAAFSPEEQEAISVTEVDNSAAQGLYKMSGGNNTRDQIFLLSYAEASQYFEVSRSGSIKARVEVTAYAVSKGAWASDNARTENDAPAGMWWLRSPGFHQGAALYVRSDGMESSTNVEYELNCVRPALWIDLNSEIFK